MAVDTGSGAARFCPRCLGMIHMNMSSRCSSEFCGNQECRQNSAPCCSSIDQLYGGWAVVMAVNKEHLCCLSDSGAPKMSN